MRYRKISIEVEAFRYGIDKEPDWFLKAVEEGIALRKYCTAEDFIIDKGNIILGMEKERFLDEYEPIGDEI